MNNLKQSLMRTFNGFYLSHFFILTFALTALVSCEDTAPEAEESSGNYVFSIRSEGSSEESTDYLLTADNLMSGEISIVGQGIEQTDYHFYEQNGNKLLTIGYQNKNHASVYSLEDGELVLDGQFSIPQIHLIGSLDEETTIAMTIPRNGSEVATFHVINPKTQSITNTAQTNVYDITSNDEEQAYFTGFWERDGLLYAPYAHIKGGDGGFASEYNDSAYVAVYSYPELEFQKLITDGRAGVVGKYIGESHIFETENGDIYTASTTSIASGLYNPEKPSGILRIPQGQSDFDEDYFFNIEEATGGYKLHNIYYIGNGKALANILAKKEFTEDNRWDYGPCNLAVLDLQEKTVTNVENVPEHFGGPVPLPHQMVEEDGMYYMKVQNEDGVYIYEIDVENATATKGAEIIGEDVFGIFDLNKNL